MRVNKDEKVLLHRNSSLESDRLSAIISTLYIPKKKYVGGKVVGTNFPDLINNIFSNFLEKEGSDQTIQIIRIDNLYIKD